MNIILKFIDSEADHSHTHAEVIDSEADHSFKIWYSQACRSRGFLGHLMRPPAHVSNAQYERVLAEMNSEACSKIKVKIKEFEKLARSVSKRRRYIQETVISVWRTTHEPDIFCGLLDEKSIELHQQADDRLATGKSLSKPQTDFVLRYHALAMDFLLRSYSEEQLKTYVLQYDCQKNCPITRDLFQHCTEKFLQQYPQWFTGPDPTRELTQYRYNINTLRIKPLLDKALSLKQGPSDPSSSQIGDLPTPSYHALGLLARAASDAEKCARSPPKKPDRRNLHQLLRVLETDGRGASEKSEDEARLSATGSRRVASRAGAATCAGAGAAAAAGAACGGAKASRRSNAPQSFVTSQSTGDEGGEGGASSAEGGRTAEDASGRLAAATAGAAGSAQPCKRQAWMKAMQTGWKMHTTHPRNSRRKNPSGAIQGKAAHHSPRRTRWSAASAAVLSPHRLMSALAAGRQSPAEREAGADLTWGLHADEDQDGQGVCVPEGGRNLHVAVKKAHGADL